MQSETESVDDDAFYFESDHLALRGNQDYCKLLRCIAMLEAQKLRVHKHIQELESATKLYLDNPELLVEKIQKGEQIIAPNYMSIVELPKLSEKYDLEPESVKLKAEPNEKSDLEQQIARGRVLDHSRSETFNRLWTNDEQRRLEQLLIEYPEEEVEMRRFTKIANVLGNRTPQQVASRVQKYFQKLYDAGLPIPGRIPKYRRHFLNKHKQHHRPTTFFPKHNISIDMPEEDFMLDSFPTVSTSIKIEAKEEPAQTIAEGGDGNASQKLLLQMLTAIRDEKIKTAEGYNPDPLAAKCEQCEEATVAQTHWRCNSCRCNLNLCLDCLADQLLNNNFDHITHEVINEQET